MFKKRRKNYGEELDYENVFFDAKNISDMNVQQMQGVLERPIAKYALFGIGVLFAVLCFLFVSRVYTIQLVDGQTLYDRAEGNAIKYDVIFNKRGVLYDRNGVELAWNEDIPDQDFANRRYINTPGFSHILGYVTYPQQDNRGKYFLTEYKGISGLEFTYNELLNGQVGFRKNTVDSRGIIQDDSVIQEPIEGLNIYLTIDAELQARIHKELARYVEEQGFDGAAGLVIDLETGGLLAMTSVPEYDSNVLADGDDRELITSYNTNEKKPFLNRAIGGTFAPGSVIKPFIASGILDRDLISPNYKLVTNGVITVPNRFGGAPAYFRDARNNGVINIREALAKSSNIYFFTFGGGFGEHKGLGINGMKEYLDEFGFGSKTGLVELNELSGFVPTPEWKRETFDEPWLLGDTYFTAIGQYSFLTTPLQVLIATAAVATDGQVLRPTLTLSQTDQSPLLREIDISFADFDVVQEGMRMVVTHPQGTARSLNLPYVTVAAKTGTAERGASRSKWNSWTAGYWPYDNPRYAFIVMAENGPAGNRLGISRTMTRVFQGMYQDGVYTYFDDPVALQEIQELKVLETRDEAIPLTNQSL